MTIFRHLVPHFPIRECAWQQGMEPLTHGNGKNDGKIGAFLLEPNGFV